MCDQAIPRYPKVRQLGADEIRDIFTYPDDEIVVQEKFDGANFRFWRDGDDIVFGSRNVPDVASVDGWSRQVAYVSDKLNAADLDSDFVYVGEATIKHSLGYNWDDLPPFIGFDILHKDTGLPVGFDFAKRTFESLEIPFINVVWMGTVRDWKKENHEDYMGESAYRDGAPEGIVIKNYSRLNYYRRPLFGKIVTEQFAEKKTAVWGPSNVRKEDALYIAETYATDARIRKIVHQLALEGRPVDRSMMGELIKRTIGDILEEHILEIWQDKKVNNVDFKMLAKAIPSRCLAVIDTVLMERA